MNKVSFVLGSDSITVFFNKKPYTINKQAHTYDLVLKAVRANDLNALENALNIRQGIVSALSAKGNGKVEIRGEQIFYADREVTGLIASRIFEVIRLGLDVKPMVRFLENLMLNPSKRATDELFGFLDVCSLPITEDGHFLAYKRVRDNYFDVHSGTMDNSVGKVLEMERNMVDEDKNRTCSAGLHFCSYEYLSKFGGERIMVLKINPRDVVAIPADYNNSKGRTCRYEVVDELPVNEYRMPETTIQDGYTNQYSNSWDEPELADTANDEIQNDLDTLSYAEENEILTHYGLGLHSIKSIANSYDISADTVMELASRKGVKYGQAKATATPVVKATQGSTSAKLSAADVKQIRKMLGNANNTLASIAAKFGVHPRSIARIRDGEAWNNV